MKINIKALTIALATVFGALILILSIWTRTSSQFGHAFMDAFNSIHPHPYRAGIGSLSMIEEIFGIGFDLFYAVIDTIIFSVSFGHLYNRIAKNPEQEES